MTATYVVGCGYVGTPTAAHFIEQGHAVQMVELDPIKRDKLIRGLSPIDEPGVNEILRDCVHDPGYNVFSYLEPPPNASDYTHFVFLCIGTPTGGGEFGFAADLAALKAAAVDAAKRLNQAKAGPVILVIRSTVPPGTACEIQQLTGCPVVSNPEFLREGYAMQDLREQTRVVLGGPGWAVEEVRKRYYPNIACLRMSNESAELAKYASNVMLGVRLTVMNELADICESLTDARIADVRAVLSTDPRIGDAFLAPGPGAGGPCLHPRETIIVRTAEGTTQSTQLGALTEAPYEVLANSNGKAEFVRVSEMSRRRYEGALLEIKTKMGRRVRVTPDHPMIVRRSGVWATVQAADVTTDDWLPLAGQPETLGECTSQLRLLDNLNIDPATVHVRMQFPDHVLTALPWQRRQDVRRNNSMRLEETYQFSDTLDISGALLGTSHTSIPAMLPNNEALWRILGLYAAEGWITADQHRQRVYWGFHPNDEEHLVDEVATFWRQLGTKVAVWTEHTSRKVNVSSVLLANWLRTIGLGKDSYDQRAPDMIWSMPNRLKRAFVAGFWAGDGSWNYATTSRQCGAVLTAATVSRRLADDLSRLLLGLGVISAVNLQWGAKSTVPAYIISISGADQVEQLVDFVAPKDHAKVSAAIKRQVKRIKPTGYRVEAGQIVVRVAAIKQRPYMGDVFSLETPGNHTFVTTGGIVVHNCLPKDMHALAWAATREVASADKQMRMFQVPGVITMAARCNTDRMRGYLYDRLVKHLGVPLQAATIGVWGLTFKPNTDDIRASAATELVWRLAREGVRVRVHDPNEQARINMIADKVTVLDKLHELVTVCATPESAAKEVDALVIATDWNDYASVALLQRTANLMNGDLLVDGRGVFRDHEVRAAGLVPAIIGEPFKGDLG